MITVKRGRARSDTLGIVEAGLGFVSRRSGFTCGSQGEAEYMNPIKCGICPYYNTLDTHCDAAGKPAVKVNVCPQRRIRKAIKAKEG